jgi:hypothetical protein
MLIQYLYAILKYKNTGKSIFGNYFWRFGFDLDRAKIAVVGRGGVCYRSPNFEMRRDR